MHKVSNVVLPTFHSSSSSSSFEPQFLVCAIFFVTFFISDVNIYFENLTLYTALNENGATTMLSSFVCVVYGACFFSVSLHVHKKSLKHI